jgi:hypothetical protein
VNLGQAIVAENQILGPQWAAHRQMIIKNTLP